MNLSEVRRTLKELKRHPRRTLGQHFLIDGNLIEKSIRLAKLQKGDAVVEIGPGLGSLTRQLLKAGAKVAAIEQDEQLFKYLKEHFNEPQLSLHCDDALRHPLAKLEADNFKIISNLPYAIATPWMELVLQKPLAKLMVLMLQKEAAARFMAKVGTKNYGAISIFLASCYEVVESHAVGPQCFYPMPKVDSVLLKLQRKDKPLCFPPRTRACMRQIFTQRRKQLKGILKNHPSAMPWFAMLKARGIPDNIRAEAIESKLWEDLIAHVG